MVGKESVQRWVRIIADRYGKNYEELLAYFNNLDIAEFEDHGDWYIVYSLSMDSMGENFLCIISCGTIGDVKAFLAMQSYIDDLARKTASKYIAQSSALEPRYNRFLEKMKGYKPYIYKKEVE